MEQRLTIELRRLNEESDEELLSEVLKTGATTVPGFDPVPMAGTPPTVCLTLEVPDSATEARIRELPNVVGIYGDPKIEGFGGP